jgi:hypothetical protein
MNRPGWRLLGLAAAVLLVVLASLMAPPNVGSAQGGEARAGGCHAWAPVFRPVLGILGAGKVLVALPARVPGFSHRVYAHANVLNPPLTFDVALSTRAGNGWPVPLRTTLLAVRGVAGRLSAPGRSSKRVVDGKTLDVSPGTSRLRSARWYDRAANITYTVTLPARLGMPALLRVTGSLTPGALRKTPVTAKPVKFNACP